MVVSDHYFKLGGGNSHFEKGGNAIRMRHVGDSAIAGVWHIQRLVTSAGFIVFMKSDGEATTFDFREKSTSAVKSHQCFWWNGIDHETFLNHRNLLSVGVRDSSLDSISQYQTYGKLPGRLSATCQWSGEKWFSHVMGPLIMWQFQRSKMDAFLWHHAKFPFRERWRSGRSGELLEAARTCQTLEAIRDQGRDGFTKASSRWERNL